MTISTRSPGSPMEYNPTAVKIGYTYTTHTLTTTSIPNTSIESSFLGNL